MKLYSTGLIGFIATVAAPCCLHGNDVVRADKDNV